MRRVLAPRLPRADYIGRRAFFLTICSYQRAPLIATRDLAESLLMRFRERTQHHLFANHAYSFMPDHVHFVIEGRHSDSDCYELIRSWKSETAFDFKRVKGGRLWHRSFFDRVMRDRDEMAVFARYVIDNPRRAGLPEERCVYPFVGSDTLTMEQIRRGEFPESSGRTFCKLVV